MTLYTSLSDWIPQPGRITRTWSSGLVLLQQEFIGNLDTLGPVAVPGDPFPADDAGTSAKVYGLPEYRELGNGLQSATVSAYGLAPGSAGVQKVESRGAIALPYSQGLSFGAAYYHPDNGEPRFISKKFLIVVEFSKEVRSGRGDINLMTTNLTSLEIYAGQQIGYAAAGTKITSRSFSSVEIFGPGPSGAPFANVSASIQYAIAKSLTEFQYYGDIWEERATFIPSLFPVGFDYLNDPPPPSS
jgi:hypothetical protein